MHEIEPFYNWRDFYIAADDKYSPFFGREYNEFEYTNTCYNFYLHPQWDEIGSPSLFIKILYADYLNEFAVIEMIGEWNDCIHNDIMYFKRDIIDRLEKRGINKFILIGENVLNFHASDDSYYEEWYEDISDDGGYIVMINFRDHVIQEMRNMKLHHYLLISERFQDVRWRNFEPPHLYQIIDNLIIKAIG